MYQISGNVMDAATNDLLTGATITERGTTNATQTADDGSFSLNVTDDVAIIDVSYIGYDTQTFDASDVPQMIGLEQDTGLLNSFAVVAIRKNPYIAIIIAIAIVLIIVNFKTIKLWLSHPPKLPV